MFSTACSQLVNEFGKDTLKPVPSLDEQGQVNNLQLVVMETKRCNTNSYHTTGFQLTAVLQDSSPIYVKDNEDFLIPDYQWTKQFSLKGQFGIDLIHDIIDIDIKASDTVTLQVKFGKVAKTQVDISVLTQELMKRKLNLDHPFIKQVRENKNKVLCLVTGVVRLSGKGQLSATYCAKVDGAAQISNPVSVEINVKNEKNKAFELDSNVALAYNFHELNVNVENGSMQIIMTDGKHGGFYDPGKIKKMMSSALHTQDIDFHYQKKVFEPILNLSEQVRNELTSVILKLMSVPRDIQIFIKLVEKRELQEKEKQLLTHKQSWFYLLELAGITVQELEEFSVPKELTPLLKCFGVLLYALSELQDEELDLIGICAPQTVPALFVTFEAGLSKTKVTVKDVETISKDDKAIELLKQLGYSVSEQEILPPKDRLLTIGKVYMVMFALWGQKSK